MSEVVLTGIASNIEGEERALAHLHVEHNGSTYEWQIYVPVSADSAQAFIDSAKQSILDDIDAKELAWSQLEPKTKPIQDPLTEQQIFVPISKEEIVKPTLPDYYSLRRNEYPSLSDQLDAMWKGFNSQAFVEMQNKVLAVKAKYPKP